jgi:uncharacterized protein
MPEYLTPGVYIEEIDIGAKPIEGVSTSTAAFLGQTERGPVGPRLVTSFEEYKRIYGGYLDYSNLTYAVEGFFSNGGKRCYICKIISSKSVDEASLILDQVIKIEALPEAKDKKIFISISGATGESGSIKNFDLTVLNGADYTKESFTGINTKAGDDSPNYCEKKINEGTSKSNLIKITVLPKDKDGTFRPEDCEMVALKKVSGNPDCAVFSNSDSGKLTVTAISSGKWGNKIRIKLNKGSLYTEHRPLYMIFIAYTDKNADKVEDKDAVEIFDNISLEKNSSSSYEKMVNGISNFVTIAYDPGTSKGPIIPAKTKYEVLENGNDYVDIKGQPIVETEDFKSALSDLRAIDGISLVCVPDEMNYHNLTDEIVSHCGDLMDRFAVISTSETVQPNEVTKPNIDSKYAALYYPWIYVTDPLNGTSKSIPPCGHVAGVYARVDVERGVHKAPANEVIRGAIGLKYIVSSEIQSTLNPKGINCIRAFPGRGIRIWGARTISSDPSWKYVNVRRLFIFLEKSIETATQWAVFEPNDEKLWARMRQTVNQFLTTVWRSGALMGTTSDEAFFVKCDRTTMTQDDIDNGRMIMLIGVAPVKPAEFVIFRIAQVAKGSEISE